MKNSKALTTKPPVCPWFSLAQTEVFSKIIPILAVLVFFPFILTACQLGSAQRPTSINQPESQGPAMDLALSLQQDGQQIAALAARGSLEYTANNSNHYFRFELVSQKPGSFLFTILDPLGRPAVRVISDGIQFLALEYGPKVATIGEAQHQALGSYLPLGLSAEDFIALLSGSLIPEPALAALNTVGDRKVLKVIPSGPWSGSTWLVNLSTGQNGTRIDSFSADFEDQSPLSAGYSQYAVQTIENLGKLIDFPNRLDLTWGQDKKLLVRFDEVRLGFPIQPEMFSTIVPTGFSKVEL